MRHSNWYWAQDMRASRESNAKQSAQSNKEKDRILLATVFQLSNQAKDQDTGEVAIARFDEDASELYAYVNQMKTQIAAHAIHD